MKACLLFFLLILAATSQSQETLSFKGKVGSYSIEVQFQESDSEGLFTGKYRYEGKKTFIDLKGEFAPPVIYMVEHVKDDTTGFWYLEMEADSITGVWVGSNQSLNVKLDYVSGNRNVLNRKTELDFNKEVNSSLSGEYEVNIFFINDMWVNEDNLHPDLGYNGGNLSVRMRDDGNIDFTVEAVCGPTYHMAFAEGIAYKNDNEFIYTNEDACVINFIFKDKKVNVESNGSMECGFGMRAYLDHEFIKVNNEPSFSIED